MQKLFEQIADRLRSFIEQKDDIVLMVRCQDMESAYILSALRTIDAGNSPDIFWIFADNFEETVQYISTKYQKKRPHG